VSVNDDKDVLIIHLRTVNLRLRTRLTIVDPVYRAAIAAHRNGASAKPGQHERVERLEREVDRAIDAERLVAEGHVLRVSEELP
jgi:hypothetical protein